MFVLNISLVISGIFRDRLTAVSSLTEIRKPALTALSTSALATPHLSEDAPGIPSLGHADVAPGGRFDRLSFPE